MMRSIFLGLVPPHSVRIYQRNCGASMSRQEQRESTYNNDPDVFNIFRSEELAKILQRTLLM